MRIRTRLFVKEDLYEGAAISLHDEQAHQLIKVLRVRVGETLALFNGYAGTFLARITAVERRVVACDILEKISEQLSPGALKLAFAPLKKARTDFVAQRVVECGFAHVTPVITARTQTERFQKERFEANMREAAEQCGINYIPTCSDPMDLRSFLDACDRSETLFYGDESGKSDPALAVFERFERNHPSVFLVGPEGGFEPDEFAVLHDRDGCVGVGLGPRILRADTAIVVAAALWQGCLGDFQVPPRFNPVA